MYWPTKRKILTRFVQKLNEMPCPLTLGDFDLVCPGFVQVDFRLRRKDIIVCSWLELAPFSDRSRSATLWEIELSWGPDFRLILPKNLAGR